jgi:hypothetical protein
MRHNQNRRSRGRSRKAPNPLSRSYESNGPDVKVRGNAAHVADKYMSLARDAHSSGDPIAAENYLQHAEHYNRIVMAAQAQFQQSQPQFRDNQDEGYDDDRQMNGRGRDRFDYNSDSGEEDGEERGEGGETEGDRFRQPERPEQRMDDRDRDRQRAPRDRFQYRDRNDRNDRNDRGYRGERDDRGERNDRGDRNGEDRGPRNDRVEAGVEREAPPAPVEAVPAPVQPEEAPAPAQGRRRRSRPRAEGANGDEAISDGAAALAAFPDR